MGIPGLFLDVITLLGCISAIINFDVYVHPGYLRSMFHL